MGYLERVKLAYGMAQGGVVTSRTRKKSVTSKTRKGGNYKRHWSQIRTKVASRFAGDFDTYYTTAGGEASSVRAPFHTIGGTQGGFAAGGVVRGPIHALLGEAGPEVVIPLKKKFMNKKVSEVAREFVRKEQRRGGR
jgi:hypothetical protein